MGQNRYRQTRIYLPLQYVSHLIYTPACFFVTGAYASSSAVSDQTTWKDTEIQNEVMAEDGVYYIFCDGAGEENKPQTSVSVGSVKFVLVRKDSYTSIGPFDDLDTLMEDVTIQCEYMKSLTQEEKELVIKTAESICDDSEYTDSYAKLIAYKTGNYSQQSVADFNAALASTPDELYCEHMEEEVTFYVTISKVSKPADYLDEYGDLVYDFHCFADLPIAYSIISSELLTVAERDNTLLTFKEEMQNYLNDLSESEITDGNFLG